MSTLKFKLTFLLLATILINVQGQTTINYVSGFGNPDNVSSTCNLFNINPPLYTVGTFKHWPVSEAYLEVPVNQLS